MGKNEEKTSQNMLNDITISIGLEAWNFDWRPHLKRELLFRGVFIKFKFKMGKMEKFKNHSFIIIYLKLSGLGALKFGKIICKA